jgi:hypothetical protein
MHQILEHFDPFAIEFIGDRKLGMQFIVFQKRKWASQYSWLLSELDHSVEVSYHEEVGHAYRPHIQSLVLVMQSRRINSGDRCRWWDTSFLERISSQEGMQVSSIDNHALGHGPKMKKGSKTVYCSL